MVTLLGSMVHLIAHMKDTEEMRLAKGQLHTVWAIPFAPELVDIWRKRFGVRTPGGAAYGQTETGFIASTVLGEGVPVGHPAARPTSMNWLSWTAKIGFCRREPWVRSQRGHASPM